MKRGTIRSRAGLIAASAALASPALAGELIRLGWVDPLHNGSLATGVSADGSVVVGTSIGPGGVPERGFRWTAGTGRVALTGPGNYSSARGISADGQVIVGANGSGIARWTPGGVEQLGALLPGGGGVATAASGDGSRVVGVSDVATGWGYQGFLWDNGDMSALPLGDYSGGAGETLSISDDGTRSVGYVENNSAEATLWEGGVAKELGWLPSGGGFSVATTISGNGEVMGGQSDTSNGWRAVRWTESGIEEIPSFLPDAFQANAITASSYDGSVMAGYISAVGFNSTAFLWDAVNGTRDLKTLLETEYGFDLTGWRLSNVYDMSADGSVIVGAGLNPEGRTEGWIAVIPEPSAGLLMAAGLVALLRHRV